MLRKHLLFFFILSFFALKAQNNHFVSTWNISSGAFELPLKDYTNITIDWGDNTSTTHANAIFPTHTYNSSDTFTITIIVNDVKKDIGSMYMNGYHASIAMIQDISNWGEGIWNSFSGAFHGAKNLTVSATDEPNLSATTSMSRAFRNCYSLEGTNFNDWDMSTIINMGEMFSGIRYGGKYIRKPGIGFETVYDHDYMIFNGDISKWNTAAATNMQGMFDHCIKFNVGGTQDLNNWNTAKVTSMGNMFENAQKFNGDLSKWDTSNVEFMDGMFNGARTFNGNISSWDTSNVTNMMYMFSFTIKFNSDISNWDVSNVYFMNYMFAAAINFNQPIGNWDVSNVKNMVSMFSDADSFNQPIGDWDVSNVTDMGSMFENAQKFNQNIANWNTSSVTMMDLMFYNASVFETNICNWDTSNVKDMQNIFYGSAIQDKATNILANILDTWSTNNLVNGFTRTSNSRITRETPKGLDLDLNFPYDPNLKKYFYFIILLIILTIIFLFRKRYLWLNKKKGKTVPKKFILKNTWVIDPIHANLSEVEKKIAKLYPKVKVIEIIHVFEKHIFEDRIFTKQGVNIKEFSKLTFVPLRHCFYLFKVHVKHPFNKFKNFSRIESSLKLIENNFLAKGTFESLSLEVGFESYSSFYSYFKEYTSLTPSNYLISIKR